MQHCPNEPSDSRVANGTLDDFIPTRRSLLTRLKKWDDQEGWREFFETYGRLLYGLARKCGLSDAESQDAVQETLIAVAKQMPDFRYDPAIGSFKGWLFQITRRRIADQFRRRLPGGACGQGEPGGNRTATIERLPDLNGPDLMKAWHRDWQNNLLRAALERIKRRVSPKQFQMFDLYVTQQWPMEAVTETLGVNRAQVYMAKMRVSRILKQEVERLRARGC